MSFLTTQPTSVVVLGDSTGNEPGEWLRLLAFRFAKAWPTAVVQHRAYNAGGSTYDAAKTLWNGGGSTITIYNGHVGSATADYPTAVGGRLAAMVPVTPDVLIVNYGHNHAAESSATFEGKLDTLIAAVLALRSGTPIVISSQNHEKSPATNASAHNTRQANLATYASGHSYGYINTYETFQAQGTPNNFVESDGIHPTDTGLGDGSHLWAAAAESFLLPAADPTYAQLTFAQRMAALAPLGWWRLGETSGTTMSDSSGNARHGTYENTPTLGATGALTGSGDTNGAMTTNGTDEYGLVPNASWMNRSAWDDTFMAWVKTTDTDGVIMGRQATAPYLLRVTTALGLYFEARSTGGAFYASDGGTSNVRDGNWHFVVGTLRDGYITSYLDGAQLAQNTSSSPSGTPLASVVDLYIGTRSGGPYLAGSVDEPAILPYALPPEIIAELYAAGTTTPALQTTVALPVTAGLSATAMTVARSTVGLAVSVGLAFSASSVAQTTVSFPVSAGLSFAAATVEAGTTTVDLPVSAGLSFSTSLVARTTVDLPVGAGLSFAASSVQTSTVDFPIKAGLDFSASVVSTGGTTVSLPVAVGLSFAASGGDLFIPTDDESSGIDFDTDDDDLEFTPPLALPPASLTEAPMWRRSVIVPDLSAYPKDAVTGQPIVSDSEYDSFEVVEEEVGVPHVIFPDNDDPNDMTYYRGLPIQGLRFLRREPFGDADADATIPGITSMDTHPDDVGAPTPFTRARANMEFILRKSDGTSRRMWSGNVFTRSLGNDGRQPTMNLHALGSLYMADSTRNRPVVSDDPLDYGYLIPRAFNLVTSRRYRSIAHIATGILTRERGAWSDSPMGFALDGLAKCWTLAGNQWTIAKVVGSRRQYEMRLKKTAPEWTFTNGARGVYVDLEEDDNGRNVVFGHGVNADGGIWFNTKYPDNGGVRRVPLAADPRTQRYLYDDDGNITDVNPDYDGNVLPREDDVDFGQNSKTIGERSAQQIVDRESVPSFVGRITVETDPREGWRGDIQAGDKLTLIGYQGRDLILHVSDVEVSLDGSVPVSLTVDERSRDAMTVAQIRDRNKEARRDPALRPGNPNRRSRLEQDQIVPFDAESKAGRIPATSVQGGQWNIITVPFATAGRIAKVHFETGSPMAAGLFAYRPSVAHLNSLIGNPLTQDDPLKANMNTLEGTFGLCAFWGQQGQRMGYSPGREDAGDPFTGDFDEATGFDYVAQANARLYFAVWTAADTTVSGRCFPALVV